MHRRMLRSILPQVRELGLKGLVIAYQGSIIAEIESGKIIKFSGIPHDGIVEICRTLEELNQPINVYSDNDLFTDIPKDNQYLQLYERIVGVEAEYVEGKISDFVSRKNCFARRLRFLLIKTSATRFITSYKSG